jgi:hypothetical protein
MLALPFKLNQDGRHHTPRQQHKVTLGKALMRLTGSTSDTLKPTRPFGPL